MLNNDLSANEIATNNNWVQESNSNALGEYISKAIAKYPEKVAEYKGGKKGLIGLFMGEVMKLIPIALSALVVAFLIESFVFLPIHAAHTLKSGAKVTDWTKVNGWYSSVIHFFMRWKKSFLIVFTILVPLLIVVSIKTSKFQMFPSFDANDIQISIKANQNTTLEESFAIVQKIEQDLIQEKEKYYIKSISSRAGYRKDSGNNTESFPYVMYMTVELEKLAASNFLDNYITPYLSF